jgi:hypothetical protein
MYNGFCKEFLGVFTMYVGVLESSDDNNEQAGARIQRSPDSFPSTAWTMSSKALSTVEAHEAGLWAAYANRSYAAGCRPTFQQEEIWFGFMASIYLFFRLIYKLFPMARWTLSPHTFQLGDFSNSLVPRDLLRGMLNADQVASICSSTRHF